MNLSQLSGKKIAILGLGIENYALVNFLLKHKVKCEITICDARNKSQLNDKFLSLNRKSQITNHKLNWKLGKDYNKGLDKFDILFRSPGWPVFCPEIKAALKAKKFRNSKFEIRNFIYSPMKLFFDLCPTKNIIGVTGTKGKGTTSSLIYEMLKTAGKRVWLGGNIGVAPFSFIGKIKKNDSVVLELSSFQLEDLHKSPKIAVVTNFYKEHLAPADPNNPNYHKTLSSYWDSKMNIIKFQKKNDFAILNKNLKLPFNKIRSNSINYFFGSKDSDGFVDGHSLIIRNTKFEIRNSLPGNHNLENIAAAALAAKSAGAKIQDIQRAVKKFKGLEHRIEKVAKIAGVTYYNDSFATTPESTITALKSFSAPIILLAGGAEKKSDFRQLAKVIKRKVKFVILLNGDATPRIKKELAKISYPKNKIKLVFNISDAVRTAKTVSAPDDIVLLSTACASFGMFKNYKERGKLFKNELYKLAKILHHKS